MTQPNHLFGRDFSSVLSQLRLAADAASTALSKLLATAPQPQDAAGFTHVCTGAHAALSAALEFLKDPNETAKAIGSDLASLQQRVGELTFGMPGEELAMPKGRRLKKFPSWKMLMELGQPGVSKACLIAGGLLLMHAWHTGRRIPRAQALSVAAEAQRCEMSNEGLRLLLESPVDAKHTGYPWLTQLQRNWPQLLNLFTVDGGNHPPKPPSFTHRVRGQLIAAAEHASVAHRAGTCDHRHLSPGQFHEACLLVVKWNAADDWRGVYAETAAQSRLTADLLGAIPLASAMPDNWIELIDAQLGCLQADCSCVAPDAAATPETGRVVPSAFIATSYYSVAAAVNLARRLARYPAAKTLGELYPEAPALTGDMLLMDSEAEIKPSWARWTNSFGLYMRRKGHDNLHAAVASKDFGHIPRSKLYYATVSRAEIWAAMDAFYRQIGWSGAEPDRATGIGFGCRVVPTPQAVIGAANWQVVQANKVKPAKRDQLAKLLEFHNRYVRVAALRLAALLGLREDACYELWADIDERVDLWVEVLDKVVTGTKGGLPVPLCQYVKKLIGQYRRHCAAMAWRLQTMGHRNTPLHLWLLEVVDRERVHLLCMAAGVANIRPAGSGDVIGRLPPEHALAPDFGRKLLENQLRCMTTRPPEASRKFALHASDIDALLRHEVHGQWHYASSSDFVLLDWAQRAILSLDAIASDLFADVPSGLSKE